MGLGIVQADASMTKAIYAAPGEAIGGEAQLAVDIHNFLPPKRQPRKGATGKAILLTTIVIEGNSFEATWAGRTYTCEAAAFMDQWGITVVTNIGNPDNEIRPLMLNIRTKRLKASTTYLYSYLKRP